MRTALTLLVLVLGCGRAQAQTGFPGKPLAMVQRDVKKAKKKSLDTYNSMRVYGRFSSFEGMAHREEFPFEGLDYGDLFGSGTGFMIEGSKLWKVEDVYLGGYFSLGMDSYSGKKDTDDSATPSVWIRWT